MYLNYWFHSKQDNQWVSWMAFGKPMRVDDWSYAAKVMLASALMSVVFYVAPAHALTRAELDALVPVIVQAESSGNTLAIGDKGKARGLMQIQKATWERFSDYPWADAFDPEKNVQVGRRILEDINEKLGDRATSQKIVLAYNTGRICFGPLPSWTKRHPNMIYREIFRRTK